ncbi:MAG: hypothetical protein A2Z95_01695 [Gallionellales bacterium GWA2_60_18]|nr:MAG: hypothetical protein A2Z95_01695 [Gallionellales bacterium GWA2_60_18]
MEPQRLPAIQGWNWIKRGYRLFVMAPLLWIVLLLIWLTAIILLSAVPMIGDPLASLLLPASLIGFMVGCRALEQGDELELAHLLGGFRQRTAQLVTLGGIALALQLLIFGVMAATGGAMLVATLMGQHVQDPEVLAQVIASAGPSILIGLALFSVLLMAMQFAPMLVYFNGIAPLAAMKLSLRAFLANIGPMLVYSITFTLLAILASMPMMLGWLALLPVMITSLYACYCAIFPLPAATAPGEPATPVQEG